MNRLALLRSLPENSVYNEFHKFLSIGTMDKPREGWIKTPSTPRRGA